MNIEPNIYSAIEENIKLKSSKSNMENKLKKKLISQIQRLCEKQYRKGFQQGFYASIENQMTKEQVDQFRQNGASQGYKKLLWPQTKHEEIAMDRLLAEMDMKDMDELKSLFD